MKKKLQVFVSSTWTDMILERQAAVCVNDEYTEEVLGYKNENIFTAK